MGNSKITTKSLLVVMAGLGGRRALELLAQGLVEVLAEDRQVQQQQQQGLQQQAFQAGMAAAGVVVQQGSTVRPQTHRALSGEPAFQQQQVPLQQAFQQQQVPLQAVMGPGPGMMGQYFAAAPGMAMMPGHGPALSHPVPTGGGGGAAVTPIVEEMHSPTFPEATSKSKAKPPGQSVTTVESSAPGPAADSAGATAAATVAASPAAVETPVAAPVAAPPVAAPNETPVAMPVAAPPVAAPPVAGVREVSLSPPADTSPADDSIVVERYRRAKQRPGGTSTTATSRSPTVASSRPSSAANPPRAGLHSSGRATASGDSATTGRPAAGQGFKALKSGVLINSYEAAKSGF